MSWDLTAFKLWKICMETCVRGPQWPQDNFQVHYYAGIIVSTASVWWPACVRVTFCNQMVHARLSAGDHTPARVFVKDTRPQHVQQLLHVPLRRISQSGFEKYRTGMAAFSCYMELYFPIDFFFFSFFFSLLSFSYQPAAASRKVCKRHPPFKQIDSR